MTPEKNFDLDEIEEAEAIREGIQTADREDTQKLIYVYIKSLISMLKLFTTKIVSTKKT